MIRMVLFGLLIQGMTAQSPVPSTAPVWLSGSWVMEGQGKLIEESWSPVSNGRMNGYGKTTVKGKVMEKETMSIEQGPSGVLVFKAKPERQTGAVFTLTDSGDSTMTFVNMEHDFPQRIQYRRLSEDSLFAAIEGNVNGKQRVIEFRYRRVVIKAD